MLAKATWMKTWKFQMEAERVGGVPFCTTRCPCCFTLKAAVLLLVCASEPSVHDLSLYTLGSSIMSRGARLLKIKQENISLPPLLHLLFPLFFPVPHILFLSHSLRLSLSVLPPSIQGSLYCLYKGIGVVNRCRVMGYRYWQASTEKGCTPPLLRAHTNSSYTLILMDCTHHSSKLCHWQ